MYFEQINPFVRIALVGTMNSGHTDDVHTKIKSADCRLFSMITGDGYITIEGERYPILPGTVILFPPGTEYIWEIEQVKFRSINFDYTHNFSEIKNSIHPIHSNIFNDNIIVEKVHFNDVEILNKPIVLYNAHTIDYLISEITTEFSIEGKHKDMLLSSLLKSAITTIVIRYQRQSIVRESKAQKLIRDIVSYINANYEQPISNDDVAKKFHFNTAYLNRVFRKNTGNSLHEFLVNCRIVAAREMLRSQSVSVSQVSEKCGFSSLHHFCKTFKDKTGMTPSEYRINK